MLPKTSDSYTKLFEEAEKHSRFILAGLIVTGVVAFIAYFFFLRMFPNIAESDKNAVENILLTIGVTGWASIVPLFVTNSFNKRVILKRIQGERELFKLLDHYGVQGLKEFDLEEFTSEIVNGDEIKIMSSTLYDANSIDLLTEKLSKNPETKVHVLLMDPRNPMVQCRAYDICRSTPFTDHIPAEGRRTSRRLVNDFIREHELLTTRVFNESRHFAETAAKSGQLDARSRLQVLMANDFFGISIYLRKRRVDGRNMSNLYIGFFLNDSSEAMPCLNVIDTENDGPFSFSQIDSYFDEKWDRNVLMLDPEQRESCRLSFLTPILKHRNVRDIKRIDIVDMNASGYPKPPRIGKQEVLLGERAAPAERISSAN